MLWRALWGVGVEEGAIRGSSEECYSNANGNQGSVHFILVLEVLSREFRESTPSELLYGADDLVVMADSLELEECVAKLKPWKSEMERK